MHSKRTYSSMLSSWRKQVETADRVALAPKKRGPKPDPAARQIEHLNRDIVRLRRKLERAEMIIEIQKNFGSGRSSIRCRPSFTAWTSRRPMGPSSPST